MRTQPDVVTLSKPGIPPEIGFLQNESHLRVSRRLPNNDEFSGGVGWNDLLCRQDVPDSQSISVILGWWGAFFERNGESIIRAWSHGALDIADTLGLRWPYWQTGTRRITNQLYAVSAVDRVDAWISLIFL